MMMQRSVVKRPSEFFAGIVNILAVSEQFLFQARGSLRLFNLRTHRRCRYLERSPDRQIKIARGA